MGKINHITNSELARITRLPISKARRNSREFLPPDPQASRRSGYSRRFDLNDAFKVVIGTHLVSVLGFSFHDARTIISDLWPWTESVDMLPGKKTPLVGKDKDVIKYEVRILFRKDSGFYYYVYGDVPVILTRDDGTKVLGVEEKSYRDKIRGAMRETFKKTYLYTIGPQGGRFPEWDQGNNSPEFLSSKLLHFHKIFISFLSDTGMWKEWSMERGLPIG